MKFEFLHFSKNNDHNFFDIIFRLNSYEIYLMLHYEDISNPSLIISLDGIISYNINHLDFCYKIINNQDDQLQIENIIKEYSGYFESVCSDIIQTDHNIDKILSDPLIKHFHDNFLELKNDSTILNQLTTIADNFIIEHRKYHKPANNQWNYLYSEEQQYSLFTLAYFSNEIKDCQFFIDENFLTTPLFFNILTKFESDFFHEKLHYFHYIANFSKDIIFYSIEEYIEYFLKNDPLNFSKMFFNMVGNTYISTTHKNFFDKNFISIYNESLFSLHDQVIKCANFHYYNLRFIENIIIHQQKLTEINDVFLDKIGHHINYNINYQEDKSESFYIFSLLNDIYAQKIINFLEIFNKQKINHIINSLIEYRNQRNTLDNF